MLAAMKPRDGAPAREKVLFSLKTHGPQTAAQIARRLGITEVAVRQHLKRLEAESLVEAEEEARGGVGRPSRVFAVSEGARDRFPNTHADLSVELIAAVRASFGAAGLDRVIARRARAQLAAYAERVPGPRAPLAERVEALARARSAEGYMASCRREPDGALLLVENHCPICVAAAACQSFCRDELDVFRRLLGPDVAVERVEHLLAGARRCAYRIAPREAPARSARSRAKGRAS